MLNLFDLTLKLNGFPIDEEKKHLTQILAVTEADYEAFLDQKKQEILDFHLNNNPFYKNFIGPSKPLNWEDLPIMKKVDLQKPLIERLSKGYTEKNVYINKTSGSSGDPMVFAKDKNCHALIWANIMNRFSWYGIDFNHSLQARFYGMPLDLISNAKLRLKDFLSHRYRFNIFDLSDNTLKGVVRKFQNTKFDYMNGYTGSIVMLAKYLKKENLFLDQICPTLKVCIVTSEMLFDDDKALLEERFRVPIITLFVEILDEDNKVLPHGQEGRIIVTSLYNKAHPMIRYEVGDIGILDETSTSKSPVLKKLIGRTNDIAILPSDKKSPGMTFYSITKKLFGDDGNVKEFVIIQTKLDTFEIQYTSAIELTESEKQKIVQVFSVYLEPGLNYIFTRREMLERSKSGKLMQFISKL